jgi:hypothetical protein
LKALIERQRRDDNSLRRQSEKPETRMAKTKDEEPRGCQGVHRQSAECRNLHTHKEGGFQIAPHNRFILP